jgi:hypothetical protein
MRQVGTWSSSAFWPHRQKPRFFYEDRSRNATYVKHSEAHNNPTARRTRNERISIDDPPADLVNGSNKQAWPRSDLGKPHALVGRATLGVLAPVNSCNDQLFRC